ncbi:MAG: Fe-only nitrogenase accessory AnfO family protein [Lachnospiraceae bacterium]|nr:Fe-only nitrogenase accessory AnfO family protein [Lachnospiraceae bacterium]
MIGILFNEEGSLTDFYNVHCIKIYDKKENFQVVKTIENFTLDTANLSAFRGGLSQILNELKECKVLVGSVITGIPFYFFNQNGISVCEAEAFSQELLEQLYQDYVLISPEEKNDKQVNEEKVIMPIEPMPVNSDGEYFLDFVELQKNRPEISSKKALLPFFYNTLFQKLTIVCSHVMPWLEGFLQQRNLIYNVKREDGKFILEITHKVCKD